MSDPVVRYMAIQPSQKTLTVDEMKQACADVSAKLSVRDTDLALARAIRSVATKARLEEAELDTLRTLALSCAYRIEKLNGGGP